MLSLIIFFTKEILEEVSVRESAAGIIPDADIDLYMKVHIVFSNSPPMYWLALSLLSLKLG
jgi:hypothetical protein